MRGDLYLKLFIYFILPYYLFYLIHAFTQTHPQTYT